MSQPTVAIAGGGLAGLAAACALADTGFKVTLFERRPYLGGRASSYEHPGTGEVIDNCQHVLFRCCTNLLEFYERIGVPQQIRWYDTMTFIEPGGRASTLRATPLLPAPLHTAPSLFGLPFLSLADKLALGRAMGPLMYAQLEDDGRSFEDWLVQHGQTRGIIEHFWKPVLISALSEDLDRVSIHSASQIVRLYMKTPAARHMGVPTLPLTDLYNHAGDYIRSHGGEIHFRTSLESFSTDKSTEKSQVRVRVSGREEAFDYLIAALPFDVLDRVLPETPETAPLREKISHFEYAPITGVHLWFDRQISELDHAVLLDRTIQWMFHKSRLLQERSSQRYEDLVIPNRAEGAVRNRTYSQGVNQAPNGSAPAAGSYIELVISSSKSLIEKSRPEIIDLVLNEVREFFPAAREANLIKSTVIKEVKATYSPRPGIDAHRPQQTTPWPRIFLAGDWTATGWPATMEGAVRSGYLAAEALTRAAGMNQHFLVSDLAASGLMRLFT